MATAFDDTHRLFFVLQPLTGPLLIMDPASGERQHAARATLNPSLAGYKGIKTLTLMVRNGMEATCFSGGMAEWFKAAVLKTVERKLRGFESYSLRQTRMA